MAQAEKVDVLVVGAGIVGLMSAFWLARDGRSVTLLDKDEPGRGASFGNAGILAFPEILPLAAPGSLSKAPRWLVDPLGPLTVRPAYALSIAPWLARFFLASRPATHKAGIAALTQLMAVSTEAMDAAVAEAGLDGFIAVTGTLDLYESEAARAHAEPEWRLRRAAGFASRPVERDELDTLQPGLSPAITHGVFDESGRQVRNPYEFAKALADRLRDDGAGFVRGAALRIAPEGDGARVILEDGRMITARSVVVAAGAFSKPLAASLGDRVPLDTERGYNTTLPAPRFDLFRQLYFPTHGFVVSPLRDAAIRVGGAVEFAGLDAAPNFARSKAMLAKARRFLPGLSAEGGTEWMGFRPSLPDSLPVIGHARSTQAVVYAFGHGHLGLTQSAGTGRLVADLVTGRPPAIDLQPYRPGRFARERRQNRS